MISSIGLWLFGIILWFPSRFWKICLSPSIIFHHIYLQNIMQNMKLLPFLIMFPILVFESLFRHLSCFFEDSWYITLVSYLCFLTLLTFTSYTYIGPILNQLLPLPILFQFRSAFCKWSLDFINLWISHVGSYCVIFFISKLSWLPLCFLPLTEKNIFGLQDNIIFLWRWLLRLFTFPTYFWRWILLLKCL